MLSCFVICLFLYTLPGNKRILVKGSLLDSKVFSDTSVCSVGYLRPIYFWTAGRFVEHLFKIFQALKTTYNLNMFIVYEKPLYGIREVPGLE